MRIKFSGGNVEPERDLKAERQVDDSMATAGSAVAVADERLEAAGSATVSTHVTNPLGAEEVARVRVEPEDRLAFRVGVNILTLVLIGLAVYLVWRRYFAGG